MVLFDSSVVRQFSSANFLLSPALAAVLSLVGSTEEFLRFCQVSHHSSAVLDLPSYHSFCLQEELALHQILCPHLPSLLAAEGVLVGPDVDEAISKVPDIPQFVQWVRSQPELVVLTSEWFERFLSLSDGSSPTPSDNKSPETSRSDEIDLLPTAPTTVEPRQLSSHVIWLNPPATELSLVDSSPSRLFEHRFQLLKPFLVSLWQELPDRPKHPGAFGSVEVNERVFLTGLVVDATAVGSQLHHAKATLVNFDLRAHIEVLISLSKLPQGLPAGAVVGVVGRVTEVEVGKPWDRRVRVTAEEWFRPGFSPPDHKPSPPASINESWLALVGSPYLPQGLEGPAWQAFVSWLRQDHPDFRLRYVAFVGGLWGRQTHFERLPTRDLALPTVHSPGVKESYQALYSQLAGLPPKLHFFFVPGLTDLTRAYLPQPPIAVDYQTQRSNFHFLSNPSLLQLEGRKILLYNPFPHFGQAGYRRRPDRYLFDLLEYRVLNPVWAGSRGWVGIHSRDQLSLPITPDFLACAHPTQTAGMSYKQIPVLTISPLVRIKGQAAQDAGRVVLLNLHTEEVRVVDVLPPEVRVTSPSSST